MAAAVLRPYDNVETGGAVLIFVSRRAVSN